MQTCHQCTWFLLSKLKARCLLGFFVDLSTEVMIHTHWKQTFGNSPEAYVFSTVWNTLHLERKHYTAFSQQRFTSWLLKFEHVKNSEIGKLSQQLVAINICWDSLTMQVKLAINNLPVINTASDWLQALPLPKCILTLRPEVELHWSASHVWIPQESEPNRQVWVHSNLCKAKYIRWNT